MRVERARGAQRSVPRAGNYIASLSQVVRWLGEKAEELGVEIYPGFAAAEVLYDDDGGVRGVATRDTGRNKDGTPGDAFEPGVELLAKQTLLAEGARGSCSEEVMRTFDLRKDCDPQQFGLGIKEVWEVPEDHPEFEPGLVQHTLGWPLDSSTYLRPRGSFSDESRRRRGCRVDMPRRRVAAPPRLRRGDSAETSRGGAATWMFREDESRRGRDADMPRRRVAETDADLSKETAAGTAARSSTTWRRTSSRWASSWAWITRTRT